MIFNVHQYCIFSSDFGDILPNFDEVITKKLQKEGAINRKIEDLGSPNKIIEKTMSDLTDRISVCAMVNGEKDQSQSRASETSK